MELEKRVHYWRHVDNYSCVLERDVADRRYVLLTVRPPSVDEDIFPLLLSEALHNLRSSLDHLAYALATAYTNPLPSDIADASQFPIVGDVNRKGESGQGPKMFASQASRIRGIHPTAQQVIEGLQPYKKGKEFDNHPLWHLNRLSNLDKHRLPLVCAAARAGFTWARRSDENFEFGGAPYNVYGGILEGEAVIARLPLRAGDRSRPMRVHFSPMLYVAFADGFLKGQDVATVLDEIYTYITDDVLPGLSPYL